MPRLTPNNSITIRAIKSVMLVSTVLVVISIALIALVAYVVEKQKMEAKFADIQQGYVDVISTLLWFNDQESIKLSLAGICRVPGIASAEVVAQNTVSYRTGYQDAGAAPTASYPLRYVYNQETQELGVLRIIGSNIYMFANMLSAVTMASAAQVFSVLALSVLIMTIIYKLVIDRLLVVTEHVSRISPVNLGDKLTLGGSRGSDDEIDKLATAINRMTDELNDAFTQKDKAQQELKWHTENLEKIVEERTGELRDYSKRLENEIEERRSAQAEREKLIEQLQKALLEVNKLSGLLPICSNCKKIRDDHGYWKQVEEYITDHSEAEFTHGICPDCIKILYPEFTPKPTKQTTDSET